MTWKERLEGQIEPEVEAEIEVYATQLELKRRNGIDDKIFAESRLRRGVYGQRYDNGQRHDGIREQELAYPQPGLKKGPDTVWDAPGMQRIKIPFGRIRPAQLETLADLSEEYADGILHVTTRQDFQFHFVHIDDTPDLMLRLAAAGITTREACGNVVRNVTACPLAGVCGQESFDVSPYAKACARYLLGHPDAQDFGRKFKISFSGCREEACALAHMHDIGAIARLRLGSEGKPEPGFEVWVGGGLGAVPHQAELFSEFLPVRELLPVAQAMCRVFARLGEKKIRSRARLKFLVANLGIEKFKELVWEERNVLPDDPRWEELLPGGGDWRMEGSVQSGSSSGSESLASTAESEISAEYSSWRESNVLVQKQPGFCAVTVSLPLGDLAAWQARRLADLARHFETHDLRTTVEQNLLFRWIPESRLSEFHSFLGEIGLQQPGAGSIVDITACPGTDTCKLGIASSRGLAGELRKRLAVRFSTMDRAVRDLRIKISGCFNSCGQHHVADIGFYGTSRTFGGRKVPHFQVVLGGQWKENSGSYGLAVGSIPSKIVPEVLDRIVEFYLLERHGEEPFTEFTRRIGKSAFRRILEDYMKVPDYESVRDFYSDWGDPREFSLVDMGIGECAGEVVSLGEFELAAAERLVFEAQLRLDEEALSSAGKLSYRAMQEAAVGLIKARKEEAPSRPDRISERFRELFVETRLFRDRFAGDKFANFYLRRGESPVAPINPQQARQFIEEAQLFIEASHACRDRLSQLDNSISRKGANHA